jgi:NADH dehydrogenase
VVIVGGGFGGLRAARALRGLPVEVVLLDRNNYHLFQPLLYQVATAGLSPGEIAHPVRTILRRQLNFQFRLCEVTDIDLAGRRLETSSGTIDYDFLILAVGSETSFFGMHALQETSLVLKDLPDAVAMRNHILSRFELAEQEQDPERRGALLTFVVVGGGPTGVECAGAISELIRLVLVKDYPKLDFSEVRVILLELQDHLLDGFPDDLQENARQALQKKRVEVLLNTRVTGFDRQAVSLDGEEQIRANTLIWAAGVRAGSLVDRLGVEQSRQGRLPVLPSLQLAGYPHAFVVGDAAYLESGGQPLPMMAPVAIQQGDTAARNILHLLRAEKLEEFVFHDPGSLATVGRNRAVARIGHFRFSGFFAWLVWLVVHIYWLIGFRNRMLVLINWIWDYLFYERAVRLITRYDRLR